jgi:hypothetical protein
LVGSAEILSILDLVMQEIFDQIPSFWFLVAWPLYLVR